ncbi:MAG: hypothetical protein F2602_00465 [Actinobacteria bacterium]|uniref:Unannotated protein n=1 Tax=freshwater metagenome TaxID=449393 RepID=A0A6J6B856_9ZZZZ|nr:hypothetical protein [Actinomycetota bacterium]MTA20689.1 hypothetical protein [Actinomycetota bacterium]
MVKIEKKSNTRFQIATVLFILAIITPFLLSLASSKSEQYWVIARPIPSGSKITLNDLKTIGLRIDNNEHDFLASSTNLNGLITTRSFLANELVDVRYLSDARESRLEEVSVAVASSDIPMKTKVGDYVSIFLLQDAKNGELSSPPIRILSGVFISDLDRKGSNFGNTISLSLSLDQESVPALLAASSRGRLVLVGKNG